MIQTATTLEQSKILLEIGIKQTTADMQWKCDTVGVPTYDSLSPHIYFLKADDECGMYDIPAWSLSALISLLPEYIDVDIEQRYELDLTIHDGMYCIMYKDNYTSIGYYVTEDTDIFEAIIAMLQKLN